MTLEISQMKSGIKHKAGMQVRKICRGMSEKYVFVHNLF